MSKHVFLIAIEADSRELAAEELDEHILGHVVMEDMNPLSDTLDYLSPVNGIDDIHRRSLAMFPKSQLGEDNDGQVVIYTNYKQEEDGVVTDMDEETAT
jgi:hypothetical protein